MPSKPEALWDLLSAAGALPERSLYGFRSTVGLASLQTGSLLGEHRERLRAKSVLLALRDPLAAAVALIELDGWARRLVLYPPDVPPEHLQGTLAGAEADAILRDVHDELPDGKGSLARYETLTYGPALAPLRSNRTAECETEWILLTSGTTGAPKLVLHTLSSLVGAVRAAPNVGVQGRPVWGTFYDIRRFGGLQILLRALVGGGSMVLPSPDEPMREFLIRAGAAGITHITGTPSHWRKALMSGAAERIAPQYARLSGEIADQPILDALRAAFPNAKVAHAFASTEAGVAFDVGDGLAGFPARLIGLTSGDVQMKVEGGSLRIRSLRKATRYLGAGDRVIGDADGFVDTGDVVELRGDRYYFVGRKDGVINVGGLKVHPEEIEAVINLHPRVQMSLVKAKKNPITGAVVVADVVLKSTADDSSSEALKSEIIGACRRTLASHKIPATIRFVPSLAVSAAGKLIRSNA